jgi:hypothetical protein
MTAMKLGRLSTTEITLVMGWTASSHRCPIPDYFA